MLRDNDVKQAADLLIDLGLTDYEARAYITLLRYQPASAYEVSKKSGIPSSKIYETISRLQDKGLAQPTTQEKERGKQYIAIKPEDFIDAKREETIRKTDKLKPLLDSLGQTVNADLIWQINDRDKVFDKARQLIKESTLSILVSLWPDELAALRNELRAAEKKGVKIAMLHFGKPNVTLGATFRHPGEQTIYEEKGGRALTLVIDSQVVLIGTFFDDGKVEAVWSKNHGFVTVAEDYVRHDVYITKVTTIMDKELKETFGENFRDKRDVFKPI
jgi:sugar-specific transcriptional regulator TrmB